MSEIEANNMFFGGFDVGKMNNLGFSVVNFSLIFYCAYYFRKVMLNKKKKDPKSKTTSVPGIYVLMAVVLLCRSFSLLLKVLCSPSLPLTIVCNFLSETPMLFLFVLICTGWPLVKSQLLPKDKLLLIGVVLVECFMAPALKIVAAYVKGKYTPNQYYEGFELFRFALLSISYKSSTHYLKEKGSSTQGQAYTSVCYIQLFYSLYSYCSDYWVVHAALAYSPLSSSYNLFLNELVFMVLCVVFANKFILELLYVDDLLLDDKIVDLLPDEDKIEDDDQEIAAIKALANY